CDDRARFYERLQDLLPGEAFAYIAKIRTDLAAASANGVAPGALRGLVSEEDSTAGGRIPTFERFSVLRGHAVRRNCFAVRLEPRPGRGGVGLGDGFHQLELDGPWKLSGLKSRKKPIQLGRGCGVVEFTQRTDRDLLLGGRARPNDFGEERSLLGVWHVERGNQLECLHADARRTVAKSRARGVGK